MSGSEQNEFQNDLAALRGETAGDATRNPLSDDATIPAWVQALDEAATRAIPIRRRHKGRRAAFAASGVLAVAATALLAFGAMKQTPLTPNDPASPYVGARRSGALAVYIKRAQRTWLWTGDESLIAGDSISLRVSGAKGTFVHVVDVAGGSDVLLVEKIESQSVTLSKAWSFDGAREEEHLGVLYAPRHLNHAEVIKQLLPENSRQLNVRHLKFKVDSKGEVTP